MRTPAFFFLYKVRSESVLLAGLPKHHRHISIKEEILKESLEDAHTLGFTGGSCSDLIKYVEDLVERAINQDVFAIKDLMFVLTSNELLPQAAQHILRMITATCEDIRQSDLQKMEKGEIFGIKGCLASPMVANWPLSSTATNIDAYRVLAKYLMPESCFSGDIVSHACRVPKIIDLVAKLDHSYRQNISEEPLLSVTSVEVARFNWNILYQGYSQFKEEEMVLYGYERDDEPHWFHRRQAAINLGQLALRGNENAVNLMCVRLLKDEQWMVRQVAVADACTLIGTFETGCVHLHSIVDALRPLTFNCSDDLEVQAVQRAAEDALCQALPTYAPHIKSIVLDILRVRLLKNPHYVQHQKIFTHLQSSAHH